MNKLVKIEHPAKGIWYFTAYNKAAAFIGCTLPAVRAAYLGHIKKVKGWSVDLVDDDGSVLRYFINPNDADATTELKNLISDLQKAIKIIQSWESK